VLPPGGLTLPDCSDGQLISVGADRTLSCAPAPSGKLSPPSCQDGVQALTSENSTLKCVNKGSGATDATIKARIDKLTKDTADLTSTITVLSSGGGAKSVYVGSTTATTPGRIDAGGTDIGIAGAVKLCTNQYGAGAHMCTIMEIYDSVQTGKIVSGTDIAKSWVYQEGWNNPAGAAGATKEPTAGLNENCAGYTYKTGDQNWVGTAFAFAKVTYNNNYAPKFYSGSADAACSAVLPVACCK
jgi:hypothetical protein